MLVAALQEQEEQRVEALRQVLHVLRHRAGDIHQAEHDRAGDRAGHRLEPAVADVDRVDPGDALAAAEVFFQLDAQCRDAVGLIRLALQRGDLGLQRQRLRRLRPAQRDPAGQAVAHGPRQGKIGGRAGAGIPRPVPGGVRALHQPALRHIRQFQIIEVEGEEFLPAQDEAEAVLPGAIRAALAAGPTLAAALRPLDFIAFAVFLVAGQHMVADAAGAVMEARFADAMEGDADLSPLIGRADVPLGAGVPHRILDQRLGAAQEALAVGQAPPAGVEAAIQDLHSASRSVGVLNRPASPACTIPPAGAPDVQCSPGWSSGSRTPRASSPSPRPSWSRRR